MVIRFIATSSARCRMDLRGLWFGSVTNDVASAKKMPRVIDRARPPSLLLAAGADTAVRNVSFHVRLSATRLAFNHQLVRVPPNSQSNALLCVQRAPRSKRAPQATTDKPDVGQTPVGPDTRQCV